MPSVPPAASVPVASAGVVVAAELGQRHLAHGRGGRERGAADRAETGAGADRAIAMPPRKWPTQALAARNRSGESPRARELAHQHEQRHDREVVVREPPVGEVLSWLSTTTGRTATNADDADEDHRVGDRHAHRDQEEKAEQPGYSDKKLSIGAFPPCCGGGGSPHRAPVAASVTNDASSSNASETRIGGKPSTAAASGRASPPHSAHSYGNPTSSAPEAAPKS